MCAARHGHSNLIELLVAFGAEVDTQDDKVGSSHNYIMHLYILSIMQTGCTALTIAAKANQIHATDYLLERRADPNICEKV